jgi:hypothetical protein
MARTVTSAVPADDAVSIASRIEDSVKSWKHKKSPESKRDRKKRTNKQPSVAGESCISDHHRHGQK